MDKLKPILAQKFWILFFIVLVMPLAGYFMSKGKLAAEIADRWGKLDKAFTDIPAGTGVPNESWTTKLNEINKQQMLHNRRANQELWAKQQERMFWPKDIAPIMAKAEYFKDLTEEQKGGSVIFKYPLSYESQMRALWEIVDPLDDGINLRDSDKRRKVAFAMADLHQSNMAHLGTLQPTFADIWNAQEDIWLQTELLHAIRRLNANAISQGDAFVKQLGKIQLFGGAKSTGDGGGAAAAGGGTSGFVGENMGLTGGSGFGMQRSESSALSADIKLSEEFDVSMDASSGGGASGLGGFNSGAGGFTDANSGGASAGAAPKAEVKRYIDLDDKQPYKRRAFYFKVTMDHRKVPDLIAELMNSPFPVEIIRVQQVWLSDSTNTPGGGSGSGGGTGFAGFKPTSSSSGDSSAALATSNLADEDMGLGNSGSGSGSGVPTGRTASSNPGSAAALADPNLAQVAILGVWTLYRPPEVAPDAEQTAPPSSAAPAAGLAVTPENNTSPAESDAATADSKPTTAEPTEGSGNESKKADDPDAQKSDPAKPEKTDSDSDKPAEEKSPPKDDAADKSDSETK